MTKEPKHHGTQANWAAIVAAWCLWLSLFLIIAGATTLTRELSGEVVGQIFAAEEDPDRGASRCDRDGLQMAAGSASAPR